MLYDTDPYLMPFKAAIDARHAAILACEKKLAGDKSLNDAINSHLYYGLHKTAEGGWVLREWAPNASRIYLIGECNNWKRTDAYALHPVGDGNWELTIPGMFLSHGSFTNSTSSGLAAGESGSRPMLPGRSRIPRPRSSAPRSGTRPGPMSGSTRAPATVPIP